MISVLRKESRITVPQVERLTGGLREITGYTDQKICKSGAGFGAIDIERPVEGCIRMFVHLVAMKLSAEFEGVRSQHL